MMDASIVTTKGDATPRREGWRQKTPITVRLNAERYRKLTAMSGQFVPRKTHQQIIVEALDMYFKAHG
jgi:hypothetical protein